MLEGGDRHVGSGKGSGKGSGWKLVVGNENYGFPTNCLPAKVCVRCEMPTEGVRYAMWVRVTSVATRRRVWIPADPPPFSVSCTWPALTA